MRLVIVLLLVGFVLSNIFLYEKNKIDNHSPNTLSYYVKKSRIGPLTEKDLQEIQKLMYRADNLLALIKVQNKTLQQKVDEMQQFYFYILAIFSGVYFLMQFLTWEYSSEHFLSIFSMGVLFIISGVFSAYLSEQKITDILLLKPCIKYMDSPLTMYAQRPITGIVFGYILIFNTVVCFVIDRVLTAKENKSMFAAKD